MSMTVSKLLSLLFLNIGVLVVFSCGEDPQTSNSETSAVYLDQEEFRRSFIVVFDDQYSKALAEEFGYHSITADERVVEVYENCDDSLDEYVTHIQSRADLNYWCEKTKPDHVFLLSELKNAVIEDHRYFVEMLSTERQFLQEDYLPARIQHLKRLASVRTLALEDLKKYLLSLAGQFACVESEYSPLIKEKEVLEKEFKLLDVINRFGLPDRFRYRVEKIKNSRSVSQQECDSFSKDYTRIVSALADSLDSNENQRRITEKRKILAEKDLGVLVIYEKQLRKCSQQWQAVIGDLVDRMFDVFVSFDFRQGERDIRMQINRFAERRLDVYERHQCIKLFHTEAVARAYMTEDRDLKMIRWIDSFFKDFKQFLRDDHPEEANPLEASLDGSDQGYDIEKTIDQIGLYRVWLSTFWFIEGKKNQADSGSGSEQ